MIAEEREMPKPEIPGDGPVLITGASGYVGGHLLRVLAGGPRPIRCLVRRPEARSGLSAPTGISPMRGDVLDRDSVARAIEGVSVAYYLVHSMASAGPAYVSADRQGARNFAAAARAAGVRRIIYLGALGDPGAPLSAHLRSRQEVGDCLRESGVQVIEFRAGVIIGAGSLSFEMVRALAERLPVMVTPQWLAMPTQPIAIADVIAYLAATLDLRCQGNQIFEIGGADQASYGEIIREYARQRGLRRLMIAVPVLTPRLSSWWLRLVTPMQARVGRELVEGVRHRTVVRDDRARANFAIRPVTMGQAIADALRDEDRRFARIRWSEPRLANSLGAGRGVRMGNRIVVSRAVHVDVPLHDAFAPIRRIGGDTGWYYAQWIWRMRAMADRIVGGPGMRRGRRDGEWLREGDRVDFWRVECFEPNRKLTLAAEMKVPGRAWLDFETEPDAAGSTIRQTAIFDSRGVSGRLYWYLSYPIHQMVFAGMLRAIAAAATRASA